MKYLKRLGVVIMIVVLPAISWYYLDTGYDFRKDAIEKLKPKGSIENWLANKNISLNLNSVAKGRASLLVFRSSVQSDETYRELFDQFKTSDNFQMIMLNQGYGDFDTRDIKGNVINFRAKHDLDQYFVLLDDQMQVRNEYTLSQESLKEMVQHIAITIPRDKPRDVKIQKSNEQ